MSEINIGKRQMSKNIIMNLLAFLFQLAINLYIAPIVVGNIDSAAYGFVSLANDFVSYATIITSIFNSVAARFIANEFYRGNILEANKYFNSLLATNVILSAGFSVLGIFIVVYLDQVLIIPGQIVQDVKITFGLVFLAYIVNLLTTVFTTSTFVTNRTDIQGARNIVNYIIRFSIIVGLFTFLSVKIYWIALATLIANAIIGLFNIKLTNVLTPELRISIRNAGLKHVLVLASSGIWMAITSISSILIRGLDLVIANRMIGTTAMGLLSVARMMPNNVTAVINTLAPLFTPSFIFILAKKNKNSLNNSIDNSIRVMMTFLLVPVSGFIVLSRDFYALWQPSLDINEVVLVAILSNITILQAFFNASTATLAQISVVTNKLKTPVLVSLACGIVNVIVACLLIRYTNMGVLSLAVSSTVIMLLRYLFFNPTYAAYCLEQSKWTFYKPLLKSWLLIPLVVFSMIEVYKVFPDSNSWGLFCVKVIACGFVGYIEVLLVLWKDIYIPFLKKIIR